MADQKLSVCEIVRGEGRGNEERGRASLGSPGEVTPIHPSVLPVTIQPVIFSAIHSLPTHLLSTVHPPISLSHSLLLLSTSTSTPIPPASVTEQRGMEMIMTLWPHLHFPE